MIYLIAGYTLTNTPICFVYKNRTHKHIYRECVAHILYDGTANGAIGHITDHKLLAVVKSKLEKHEVNHATI